MTPARRRRVTPPQEVNVRVDTALLAALRRACGVEDFAGPELKWTPRQRELATHQANRMAVERAMRTYINAKNAYLDVLNGAAVDEIRQQIDDTQQALARAGFPPRRPRSLRDEA